MPYDGAFHASAACWALFGDVLAREFSNVLLFGQVHQLSVDAYAVQHAGGAHPDKSVAVHLVGLHLVHQRGIPPRDVPPRLQRLARSVGVWPRLPVPRASWTLTAADVAAAATTAAHATVVRRWAAKVWAAWAPHHAAAAALAAHCHGGDAVN